MKKKLLSAIIALTALFCLSFAFTACKPEKAKGSVTVTLLANGGEFSDSLTEYPLTREEGAVIGTVPVPKRDGYVFEGWTTEEGGSLLWTAEDTLSENTTLYAKWAEKVTVTYDCNGGGFTDGEIIFCEDIKINTAARQPEQPVRENFEFGGWYLGGKTGDKVTLSTEYDFTKTVDNNLTLYAKWNFGSAVRLAAPSVKVEYGIFSWNEVEGAKSYNYIIEDADGEIKDNYDVYDTKFTFPIYYSGDYKVKVRANGNGINTVNSAYSTAVTFSAGALSGVNASVSLSDSVLGWEITNTKYVKPDSYDLYIYSSPYVPDSTPLYSEEKLTVTSFDMSGYQAGEYVIKIVANKQYYTSSESILTVAKNRLASPNVAAVSADDDFTKFEVSWKEVACADTYIITVGDDEYKTENSNCKIERGEGYSSADSVIYVPASQETVTVSAFDSKHDHLISQPQELELPQKTSLAKLSVTNGDTAAGSVKLSGGAYVHKQPPYKISFNRISNLLYHGCTVSSIGFKYSGSAFDDITLAEGAKITYPHSIPVLSDNILCSDGYCYFVFRGWFTDVRATELYDFDAPVTGDTVIYAGWQKIAGGRFYNCTVESITSTDRGVSFNCNENYFVSLKDMTYRFRYNNAASGGENALTVTNVTKGETILDTTVTETTAKEVNFTAKAGDIIYFSRTAVAGTKSLECSVYSTDNQMLLPSASGKAVSASYTYVSASSAAELFAVKGNTVTLTATEKTKGTFLGWFDASGNKVSDKLELTVTVTADAAYTAKWNTESTN